MFHSSTSVPLFPSGPQAAADQLVSPAAAGAGKRKRASSPGPLPGGRPGAPVPADLGLDLDQYEAARAAVLLTDEQRWDLEQVGGRGPRLGAIHGLKMMTGVKVQGIHVHRKSFTEGHGYHAFIPQPPAQ